MCGGRAPRPAVCVEHSGWEPTGKRPGLPRRSRWGLRALGGFGSLFLFLLLLPHVPRSAALLEAALLTQALGGRAG